MYVSTWVACVSLLLPTAVLGQYNLVKEYAGESFFDDWTFYNNCERKSSFAACPPPLTHLTHCS